jgi:hypothetical protein
MTQELLFQLKENEQDFEWYPTTERMIETVSHKCATLYASEGFSLLDIGAGDGRVLDMMDKNHRRLTRSERDPEGYGVPFKYAIEKSPLLIQAMPDDVTIVGTEFQQQTLIDKKVGVIFCNPPYSEFDSWMIRIIKESNCQHIFMVVPERWKDDKNIAKTIKIRKANVKILASADFLSGAYRTARAKVDILHFDMLPSGVDSRYYNGKQEAAVDPFDLWFEEHFKVNTDKKEEDSFSSDYSKKEAEKKHIRQLVRGKNQIQSLVELYRADMDKLIANYQAVGALDQDILRELGVSVDGLKEALKLKITGLKNVYWEELFSKLDSVTRRLTTATRREMTDRLNGHTSVDFTEGNIYAVVCWAFKNANKYIDSQLVSVYREMTKEENAVNYKSNTHMTKDTWRYCSNFGHYEKKEREKALHHYALDYRIVLHTYGAIVSKDNWHNTSRCGLSDTACNYISDILTVANNLGFKVDQDVSCRQWVSNGLEEFTYLQPDGSWKLFCTVRAFKNGNIHMKFDQDFMRAFNVEAARLLGWIKTPKEAAEEMGMTEDDAEKSFMSNLKITSVPMLTAGDAA